MARFDSGIFGLMRGKIGNIVARLRYGKVYIARKPGRYKANQTEEAKRNRAVFSRRQRINSRLRKDKGIKKFWEDVDAEGLNGNTKLMIRNTPYVTYERLLPGFGFTPKSEEKVDVKNIRFEGHRIHFDFKIERTKRKKLEPPYDLYCVLVSDRWFEYQTLAIVRRKDVVSATKIQRIENEEPDDFQTVSFIYANDFFKSVEFSERCYVMIAAIKFNELKNKYEWADTYFEEVSELVPNDLKQEVNGRNWRFDD
ncbi:MAG: hypothetical protein WC139_11455 [Candidatus Kapaibacterium sp.]